MEYDIECSCGEKHSVKEGQWVECGCGFSLTHPPLKANKEPVANVILQRGVRC